MIEIIANSKSKSALDELEKIKSELAKNNFEYKVLLTTENKNATYLMDEVAGGEVIVLGGDGTINEIINNYNGEKIIYLAKGSGNDLAKSLALKTEVSIIELIKSSRYEIYDVGDVNNKKFCSGFDVGFNADVIARTNKSRLKKYFGKYIYLEKGVLSLLSLKKYYAKIEWGNESLETNSLLLLNVMVQPYEGGGIKFSEKATGRDGQFHIMIMEDMSILKFIYNYVCLLLKGYKYLSGVKFITTDKLKVTTNQKYYQIDGELVKNNSELKLECTAKYYKINRRAIINE